MTDAFVPISRPSLKRALPVGVVAALVVVGLAKLSYRGYALSALWFEGAVAMGMMAAMIGSGLWLVPLFRLDSPSNPLPRAWRLILGAGLGVGAFALGGLGLGLAGVLQPVVWRSLFLVAGALGLLGVVRFFRSRASAVGTTPDAVPSAREGGSSSSSSFVHRVFCGGLLIPFWVLGLLVAAQAPGYLWAEEGYGYDILEYHLQAPKEYFQRGRVHRLPHNVYADFPANVETLYLLAMALTGDAAGRSLSVGVVCNYLHLYLGVLTVGAAWFVGSQGSPRAGRTAAVLMGTTGWLVYLSGLAYVENGLLFFGLLSLGCLLKGTGAWEDPPSTPSPSRGWILPAGIFGGLACGCKYTAVPFFVAPYALVLVFLQVTRRRHSWTSSIASLALFLLGVAVAFGPWLIKNAVLTGNPVFPLANGFFEAYPEGWSRESQARWDRGHAVAPEEQSPTARLSTWVRHVVLDPNQRFGLLVLGLGVLGTLVLRRFNRLALAMGGLLILQVLLWLTSTHLYARFAVVFLVPLVVLGALVAHRTERSAAGRAVVNGVLLLGVGWNLAFAGRLCFLEGGVHRLPGWAEWIRRGELPGSEYYKVLNEELPPTSRVLLVGDAKAYYFLIPVDYAVVFNENPLARAVRSTQGEREIVNWLDEQGYTHVLVNWMEMARLRRSRYGFDEEIDEELFARLESKGLPFQQNFFFPDTRRPYATLYRVAPKPPPPP